MKKSSFSFLDQFECIGSLTELNILSLEVIELNNLSSTVTNLKKMKTVYIPGNKRPPLELDKIKKKLPKVDIIY